MPQTPNTDVANRLTFRRYQDGDSQPLPWNQQIFEADTSYKCPTYVHRTPPCQGSCPSGHEIRGWLTIVRGIEKPPAGMTWKEYAFHRATNSNPFPSIMGRVCPAPCQQGCNRNVVEDFVGINSVEHYIGDTALQNGYKLAAPGTDTGKRVAIIGGGPAGLAAAWQLRRKGHACTVFDDHPELGGLMRYGIPGYRIPREVLQGEIQRILDLGLEVRLNTRVGRDVSIDLLEKEFDAILWAMGCKSGYPLQVPGGNAPNCIEGIEFLSAFNEGRLQFVPRNIIVIGGGDTAIDVASVSRRLGYNPVLAEQVGDLSVDNLSDGSIMGYAAHDAAILGARQGAQVTLTTRRPVTDMNAAQHEVQDALREGVAIHDQVMPVEVLLDQRGYATGLKVVRCQMVKGKQTAIPGTEYVIQADLIVPAMGQFGDFRYGLESLDGGKGLISTDPHYQIKNRPGHFAAGDIIKPHLLTTAIGQASVAVEGIDNYLKSNEPKKRPKVDVHHFNLLAKLQEANLNPQEFNEATNVWGTDEAKFAVHNYEDRATSEVISHEALFLGHFPYTSRHQRHELRLTAEQVLGHFSERISCLSEKEVVAEAERCMSCGMCFECNNCVTYCPQGAVRRVPAKQATTGRYVYTDYNRCVGCHICADVCPTGYINMGLGS